MNEDIPQSDKRFAKRNCKLLNIEKYTNQNNSNSQIEYYESKNKFVHNQMIFLNHFQNPKTKML